MTRLFNNPDDFADELVEGFAAASARWVRAVPGGVVRSTRSTEPKVAVVIGGGSGHYPAFGGLVGPGLAAGAAMGNLFASPSAQQVYSVAKVADQGRGVLFSFGNYAGDVLHFGEASEKLEADGIEARTVLVTDDIWSAPVDQLEKRRGIAGDLAVFKVAGAAAERGLDLDDVERVARVANDRTRSFGVAFGGCTLPGASEPLFTVPEGRMAVGLGIHGEPGIDEVDIPTAKGLAELFVEKLLQEVPQGVTVDGARVVPILNGLGRVKYEELFVVYRTVHRLLAEAGIQIVDPEVGEFCTSFDMAGASLTLLWLNDELEQLWTDPADSAGFRRGSVSGQVAVSDEDVAAVSVEAEIVPGSDASRAAGVVASAALSAVARALDDAADELGRIDRIAGDGDHGIGMQRGSRAAAKAAGDAVAAHAGLGTVLRVAGDAWSDKGGGTSGAIWGRILGSAGDVLGDQDAADPARARDAVLRTRTAVTEFGKAEVGDKTLVDALVPFVETFAARIDGGADVLAAWGEATEAARVAADATADLVPKRGRARSHGAKSVGTADPGAVSLALIAATAHDALRSHD
jgi:dihydroxyacetone kinase